MGVLIRGMEMPTGGNETIIRIQPDGTVLDLHGIHLAITAAPVPPHGRLINADKIYDAVEQRYRISNGIEHRCERDLLDLICSSPTIIPAEEGE